MDVVMDASASIKEHSFLTMSDDVQKKVITDLNAEIEHRYEKIVNQLSNVSEEDQKKMTPGTINIINKNLIKQKNDKVKIINEQNRELRTLKNQNNVYKQYSDGKISKTDLRSIIDKSQHESNEFS